MQTTREQNNIKKYLSNSFNALIKTIELSFAFVRLNSFVDRDVHGVFV